MNRYKEIKEELLTNYNISDVIIYPENNKIVVYPDGAVYGYYMEAVEKYQDDSRSMVVCGVNFDLKKAFTTDRFGGMMISRLVFKEK